MSNVKAGDLAIVKSDVPEYNGRIVQVLYSAPAGKFDLPDGTVHQASKILDGWVLKFVGGPVRAPMDDGSWSRQAWYAVGPDRGLRPLPGEQDEDELIEAIPVTSTPEQT